MPPRSALADEGPWVPATLVVRRPRRGETTDRRNGARRPYWLVRWFVDGKEIRRRFERAGDANAFCTHLEDGYRAGWMYDPGARGFFDPDARRPSPPPSTDADPSADTVFTWTGMYWAEKWETLEPSSRSELSRYLGRARRFFVDVPPSGDEAMAVDEFLRKSGLAVRDRPMTDAARVGLAWLTEHSLPLAAVGRAQVEAFLTAYRTNQRYPDRQVSPTSERRMVADLKQCWARAVESELLDSNPWEKVRLRTRTAGGARSKSGKDALAADADLVLAPPQVFELADACVDRGKWGGSVASFVLVMGLCGLRPSEATGLIVGDLGVEGDGPGWLTVRRSRRQIPDRYLEDDEDPDWGPLKGRDLADTRRVPVPSEVAARLRVHLAEHCGGARAHDLVFHRNGRPFDLAVFGDDVWIPARRALFPPIPGLPASSPLQSKLSRLRRHDLRHSACSLWLRSGVDVTVCQRWSGHKRLSVFLDIYQGLIPGREEEGVRLLEAALRVPSS